LHHFDLRIQPWIPVRTLSGDLLEVSLSEVLTRPQNYLRIESDNPLEVASLYRFLLAVLYRALEGPNNIAESVAWFKNGFPLEKIEAYLETYQDRFDLFHPKYPFYQIAEMPSEGYTQHWSRLSTEYGSGNTSFLFNYSRREDAPKAQTSTVSPAQAARLILEHQSFCLGGLIKRFITSAPGAPVATAANTLVQGENLHQTLCLNLTLYPNELRKHDHAVWEVEPPTVKELKADPGRMPLGKVDRFTWLSRSIKLFPETQEGEGAGETRVGFLAYASAVRPQEQAPNDPLIAYRLHPKFGILPLGLSKERGFWRDFAAILPHKKGETADKIPEVISHAIDLTRKLERRSKKGIVTMVLGQINDQGKVEVWRSEAQRLPDAVLGEQDVRQTVESALRESDTFWEYLNTACRILADRLLAPSGRSAHKDDVSKLTQTFPARAFYWSSLERRFSEWLGTLSEGYDEDAVETAWRKTLLQVTGEAWSHTVRSIGSSGRALRAASQAEGMLNTGQTHQLRFRGKAQQG
jgi:CRISPR system Cascade subunit CasA